MAFNPASTSTLRRWVLPLLALLAAPLPAAAQAQWVACAPEGEVCRFDGEAMVRFGVPGHYAFATGRSRLFCDAEQFGDPAPGQRKQCDVSTNWHDDDRYREWRDPHRGQTGQQGRWRYCAAEGEDCQIGAPARVRYGVDTRYQVRQVAGSFRCDSTRFGGDPAPGVVKHCEFEQSEPWRLCAREGEFCRLPGPARVRFGADNRYVERRDLQGEGMRCANAVFGDPVPDTAKVCEYLPLDDKAAAATAVAVVTWQACAAENGVCRIDGPSLVRYGIGGQYYYRETNATMACNSASFGGDPAPDRAKQCHLVRIGR